MRQEISITAFASWKGAEKFDDPVPEINRQRENGAELDDDRVHLPETVMEIEMTKRFDDAQMSSRTDRQKFGQPLNNPEQDRQQKVIHFSVSDFQFVSISGDGFSSTFVGSNPDRFLDFGYKNFAVADLSGLGRLHDRFDHALRAIVRHHDLKF